MLITSPMARCAYGAELIRSQQNGCSDHFLQAALDALTPSLIRSLSRFNSRREARGGYGETGLTRKALRVFVKQKRLCFPQKTQAPWRRERDSNSRRRLNLTRFPVVRLRPAQPSLHTNYSVQP